MALVQSLGDITSTPGIDPDSGLVRKSVYGYDVSFTHATLPAGYKSAPHAHEGEEIFELADGELSVYLEGLEFKLVTGDLLRIPALAVHWKENRGTKAAVLHEFHNPPQGAPGSGSLLDPYEREDTQVGGSPYVKLGQTYRASRYFTDGAESFPVAPDDHPYVAHGKALWEAAVASELPAFHGSAGTNKSIIVAGETFSILYSERVGLKARPHQHAAEQLSYVIKGEVWTFVDGRVFFSKAGDVIRVPGNIIHWALVEPGTTAVTFEVHTPLQGDPVAAAKYGRKYLLPEHRVPSLSWIPGGFPTDALPAEELEAYEAGLLTAAKAELELQKRTPVSAVTPIGGRR
jgi:quercetin dioxygenase-like cupin family protein